MQTSEILDIKILTCGYCESHEKFALRNRPFKRVHFPALCVYFKCLYQQRIYHIVFDSGYAQYFIEATKCFPQKLYALLTPVVIEKTLKEQLQDLGITQIDYIFISHFHADHISGLRDFPHCSFVASKDSYLKLKNMHPLLALKNGFLPSLLPEDFENRLIDIASLPSLKLEEKYVFANAHLWLDCFKIINLSGHAKGQYGLLFSFLNLEIFLISDAVWNFESIQSNIYPSKLSSLILDNNKDFYLHLKALQKLHNNLPSLLLIPSHCLGSIDFLKKEIENAKKTFSCH